MKNNEFDDAIRRKLESIDQTYSELDIDKVLQHVNKSPASKFLWIKNPWFLIPVSVVAMFSLIKVANSLLNDDVAKVVISQKKNSVELANVHIDNIKATSIKPTDYQVGNKKSNNLKEQALVKINTSELKTKTAEIQDKQSETSKRTEWVFFEDEKKEGAEHVAEIQKVSNEEHEITKDEKHVVVNAEIEPGKLRVSLDMENLDHLKCVYIPNRDTISLNNKMLVNTDTLLANNQSDTLIKLSNYRLLSQVTLSTYSYAIALDGEWLIGDHIGIEGGLRYNTTFTENFTSRDELEKRKYHGVNDKIDHRMKPEEHFSKATIQNNILQIPVSVNYYLPTRKSGKIFVGIGSNIDVYIHQNVIYYIQDQGNMEHHDRFKASGNVVPFNSFILSAGYFRQWNQWAVKIHPYLSPQINTVNYKPGFMEFGAGFVLVYTFRQ